MYNDIYQAYNPWQQGSTDPMVTPTRDTSTSPPPQINKFNGSGDSNNGTMNNGNNNRTYSNNRGRNQPRTLREKGSSKNILGVGRHATHTCWRNPESADKRD
eukprot:scaffold6948_cov93-Cylindrotheca_fusiformis.AAC.1